LLRRRRLILPTPRAREFRPMGGCFFRPWLWHWLRTWRRRRQRLGRGGWLHNGGREVKQFGRPHPMNEPVPVADFTGRNGSIAAPLAEVTPIHDPRRNADERADVFVEE